MPQIGVSDDNRPLCPPGPGIFRLKSVETKDMQAYGKLEGELEPKLIWTFVSTSKAADGTFFEVAVFTGLKYGNEQARLTWLLDMLDPGISVAKVKAAGGLNTDKYLDNVYEGNVKHTTAPNGKVYANFTFLKPMGQPTISVEDDIVSMSRADLVQGFKEIDQAKARDAGEPDPFTDDNAGSLVLCEVCHSELTDMEAIACSKRWGDSHRRCTLHARALIAEEKAAAAEAEDIFAAA